MLRNFELEEPLEKAIEKAVETYTKSAAAEVLNGLVSETIRAMTADAAGVFLGSVAGLFLKALLNEQHSVLSRLDRLIREPLETGIRVGSEALDLPENNEHERAFRQQRLLFAVQKLDESETLAPADSSAERTLISVVQCLCLSQIHGARPLARERAKIAQSTVASAIRETGMLIESAYIDAQKFRLAAANEYLKQAEWPKDALALLSPKRPGDYRIEAQIYEGGAEQLEKESMQMRERLNGLEAIYELLKRI